jgi:hypothetical protein
MVMAGRGNSPRGRARHGEERGPGSERLLRAGEAWVCCAWGAEDLATSRGKHEGLVPGAVGLGW